jgi:hypothetical protein
LSTVALWAYLFRERLEFLKGRVSLTSELAFSDHVRGLGPGQGRLRGCKGFEAFHLPSDPLDEAIVQLNDIVQVFDRQNFNESELTAWREQQTHVSQSRTVCTALIDNDQIRPALVVDGAREKPGGCFFIAGFDSMKSSVFPNLSTARYM